MKTRISYGFKILTLFICFALILTGCTLETSNEAESLSRRFHQACRSYDGFDNVSDIETSSRGVGIEQKIYSFGAKSISNKNDLISFIKNEVSVLNFVDISIIETDPNNRQASPDSIAITVIRAKQNAVRFEADIQEDPDDRESLLLSVRIY